MKLIASIYDRFDLWPYFVSYYASQGILEFHINLWSRTEDLENYLRSYVPEGINVCFYHCLNEHRPSKKSFDSKNDAVAHNMIRETSVRPDEWFVIADLDEFHSFRGGTIAQIISENRDQQFNYYRGLFIDRVASDGQIPREISCDLPLGQQFPVGVELTKRILKGCSLKIIALRGDLPVEDGHHNSGGIMSPITGLTHHFKWFGKLLEIQSSRIAGDMKNDGCYVDESRRLTRFFSEGQGKIDISNPALEARCFINDPIQKVRVEPLSAR